MNVYLLKRLPFCGYWFLLEETLSPRKSTSLCNKVTSFLCNVCYMPKEHKLSNLKLQGCRGGVGEDGREAAWGGGGVWRLQASDDPQGEYLLSVMCDGNGYDCKLQTILLVNDFSSVWYVLLSSDGLLLSEVRTYRWAPSAPQSRKLPTNASQVHLML